MCYNCMLFSLFQNLKVSYFRIISECIFITVKVLHIFYGPVICQTTVLRPCQNFWGLTSPVPIAAAAGTVLSRCFLYFFLKTWCFWMKAVVVWKTFQITAGFIVFSIYHTGHFGSHSFNAYCRTCPRHFLCLVTAGMCDMYSLFAQDTTKKCRKTFFPSAATFLLLTPV